MDYKNPGIVFPSFDDNYFTSTATPESVECSIESMIKAMEENILGSMSLSRDDLKSEMQSGMQAMYRNMEIDTRNLGVDYGKRKKFEITYTLTPNSVNFITEEDTIRIEEIIADSKNEAKEKFKEIKFSKPAKILEVKRIGDVPDYTSLVVWGTIKIENPIHHIITTITV